MSLALRDHKRPRNSSSKRRSSSKDAISSSFGRSPVTSKEIKFRHRPSASFNAQSVFQERFSHLLEAPGRPNLPSSIGSGDSFRKGFGISKPTSTYTPKASAKYFISRKRPISRITQQHRRVISLGSRPMSSKHESITRNSSAEHSQVLQVVKKFTHRTATGYLPSNPNKVNQDAFIEIAHVNMHLDSYFFSVCDGHGSHGHEVSGFIKKRLPKLLTADDSFRTTPQKTLSRSIQKCNAELKKSGIEVSFSGSTCVTVLIIGTKLWCANVGDSRAMLARLMVNGTESRQKQWMAIALSRDHKPDCADELQRITKAGGRVEAYLGSS